MHQQPVAHGGGVVERLKQKGIVIAFQGDKLTLHRPRENAVDHRARSRAAIDIVAEQDMERARRRPATEIGIDQTEQPFEKVCAAMHIADRVNA